MGGLAALGGSGGRKVGGSKKEVTALAERCAEALGAVSRVDGVFRRAKVSVCT